jgi:hypothetical protein
VSDKLLLKYCIGRICALSRSIIIYINYTYKED